MHVAECTEHLKENKDLENTLEGLFDVIHGQCDPLMRVKLSALQTFKDMRDNSQTWELLKQIKVITHQFQTTIPLMKQQTRPSDNVVHLPTTMTTWMPTPM